MTEPELLICGPGHVGIAAAIPGSARGRCADCGAPVTIAPSGQHLISAGATPVCIRCGLARIEADPDAEAAPVNAEQIAELRHAAERARRSN